MQIEGCGILGYGGPTVIVCHEPWRVARKQPLSTLSSETACVAGGTHPENSEGGTRIIKVWETFI